MSDMHCILRIHRKCLLFYWCTHCLFVCAITHSLTFWMTEWMTPWLISSDVIWSGDLRLEPAKRDSFKPRACCLSRRSLVILAGHWKFRCSEFVFFVLVLVVCVWNHKSHAECVQTAIVCLASSLCLLLPELFIYLFPCPFGMAFPVCFDWLIEKAINIFGADHALRSTLFFGCGCAVEWLCVSEWETKC